MRVIKCGGFSVKKLKTILLALSFLPLAAGQPVLCAGKEKNQKKEVVSFAKSPTISERVKKFIGSEKFFVSVFFSFLILKIFVLPIKVKCGDTLVSIS